MARESLGNIYYPGTHRMPDGPNGRETWRYWHPVKGWIEAVEVPVTLDDARRLAGFQPIVADPTWDSWAAHDKPARKKKTIDNE
jgi:hypothetical protein